MAIVGILGLFALNGSLAKMGGVVAAGGMACSHPHGPTFIGVDEGNFGVLKAGDAAPKKSTVECTLEGNQCDAPTIVVPTQAAKNICAEKGGCGPKGMSGMSGMSGEVGAGGGNCGGGDDGGGMEGMEGMSGMEGKK